MQYKGCFYGVVGCRRRNSGQFVENSLFADGVLCYGILELKYCSSVPGCVLIHLGAGGDVLGSSSR